MNYAQILRDYILKSGKTLEQISKECEEKGVQIHTTYISKLRLGQRPAPSEKTSRVLAEVTGGDPDKLIMAGYVARAPEEVQSIISHYLDNLETYESWVTMFLASEKIKGKITDKKLNKENLKIKQEIKNLPIEERIDFVITQFNKIAYKNPELFKEIGFQMGVANENINLTIDTVKEKPINRIKVLDLGDSQMSDSYEWVPTKYGDYVYIVANDNSMKGVGIYEGTQLLCKVMPKKRNDLVKSGKIYVCGYGGSVYIRRVFIDKKRIILQSENPDFPPIFVDDKSVNPSQKFEAFAVVKSFTKEIVIDEEEDW